MSGRNFGLNKIKKQCKDSVKMNEQAENRTVIVGRNGGLLRPFQPGVSGNPSGMKKGTKHFATILKSLLDEKINVTIGEVTIQLTRAEALMLEKIRLATQSPFDAVRLRAIMDIEDRIDGKATAAPEDTPYQEDEVVVFYIPNQHNRKRRPEDLDVEDIPSLPEGPEPEE